MGEGSKGSCEGLFEKRDMLPVSCLYIRSLMFIVNNLQTNSA